MFARPVRGELLIVKGLAVVAVPDPREFVAEIGRDVMFDHRLWDLVKCHILVLPSDHQTLEHCG